MQRTHLLPALGGLLAGGLVLAAWAGIGSVDPDADPHGEPCPALGLCRTGGPPAGPTPAPVAAARPTLDAADLVVAAAGDPDGERLAAPAAPEAESPPAAEPTPDAAPDPLADVDLGARPKDPWLAPVDPYARPEASDEALAEWYAGLDVGHLVRQELRLRRVLEGDLARFELSPVQAARVAELREAGAGLQAEHTWLVQHLWNLQQAEADGVRWIAPQPLAAFAAQVREADHERLLELRWRLDRQLLVEQEHAVEVLFSTGRYTRKTQDQAMVFG